VKKLLQQTAFYTVVQHFCIKPGNPIKTDNSHEIRNIRAVHLECAMQLKHLCNKIRTNEATSTFIIFGERKCD